MKKLKLDVDNIKTQRITFSVGTEFNIEMLYNHNDLYMYLAILDNEKNYLLGHTRVVPNIDYIALIQSDLNYELRCIKLNDYAEERDYITPNNLNYDYQFFLIDKEEHNV